MSEKRGRPLKYTTDEIIDVIKQYVHYTNGEILLTTVDVAKFANAILCMPEFRRYTIGRNAEAKQYLDHINDKIRATAGNPNNKNEKVSVFVMIDVPAMLQMDKHHLGKALTRLNELNEAMADKQAELIRDNLRITKENFDLKEKYKKLSKEMTDKSELSVQLIRSRDQKIEKLTKEIELLKNVSQIAWDEEAEKILAMQGVLVADGRQTISTNDGKIIAMPDFDISKVAHPVKVIEGTSSPDASRKAFLNKLKDL